MSSEVTAKLKVTGIGPVWRRIYRQHRRAGLTPNDATLVVYGGIFAARVMSNTVAASFDADTKLVQIKEAE